MFPCSLRNGFRQHAVYSIVSAIHHFSGSGRWRLPIFGYGIILPAGHPNARALLWTDGHVQEPFTFSDVAKRYDQLLNYPIPSLPKTISGKIRRVELRAQEAMKKARGEAAGHEYFYR